MANYVQLRGDAIDPAQLTVPMAIDLVAHLVQRQDGAFTIIEIRSSTDFDAVIVDVVAELPQRRVYAFQSPERLAILFWKERSSLPDVFALRRDFPRVPHMNLFKRSDMRWICLFGEDPDEVRQRLTSHILAERILWWFAENAKGTLHRDDQALEPFLAGDTRPVYFPAGVFHASEKTLLGIYGAMIGTDKEVLVVDEKNNVPAELQGHTAALIPLTLPVQTQGVIYEEPETLTELVELCREANHDLLTPIVEVLKDSLFTVEDAVATILLLRIPKGRTDQGPEEFEYRAFRLQVDQGGKRVDAGPTQVAVTLGIAAIFNGKPTPLVGACQFNLEKVSVSMLAPRKLATREDGAAYNAAQVVDQPILAIGMGALGSQVFAHLIRKGFGTWTIVDADTLEPHNLARHEVFARRFGFPKAIEIAIRANELYSGSKVATPIVANVNLLGDEKGNFDQAAASAELILDMSASTAAARQLVHGVQSEAQRVSLFLSPSGKDLVVMAEGTCRNLILDEIEAQYLRAVINEQSLTGLLIKPEGRFRVGPGCRDRSVRIPNELVSLHAAIGSKAIEVLAEQSEPSLTVWRCDPTTMEVSRHNLQLVPATTAILDGWSLTFDSGLLDKLQSFRSAKLPNETCGVLIGQFDALRLRLYVFDALPAPADSVEDADGCRRGINSLSEAVERIRENCGGDADYVGEWHSHPDHASCSPSAHDQAQMLWIEDKMHPAGRPALMMISCESKRTTILFRRPGRDRVQAGNDQSS